MNNLAHEPDSSKECHLCETVDDHTLYFKPSTTRSFVVESMATHATWYLEHVSEQFVKQQHQANHQRSITNQENANTYKKKIGISSKNGSL